MPYPLGTYVHASGTALGRRSLLQRDRNYNRGNDDNDNNNDGRGDRRGGGQQQQPQQRGSSLGNHKGDLSSLSPLISPVQSYRSVPAQRITPKSAPAANLAAGLRRGGNAKAAAQSLAQTYSSNSDEAATAVASAATESSSGDTSAVAEALAQTSVSHPNIAPCELVLA